jgi:hypothetical protein
VPPLLLLAPLSTQAPPHGLDAGQAVKVVLPRTRQRIEFKHVKAKPGHGPGALRAALTRSPPSGAKKRPAAKGQSPALWGSYDLVGTVVSGSAMKP